MSEEEQRIRKAAGRTGGYSRSVIAGDLRVVIAELDALRLRAAGGEASQGAGDDSYMTPAQLRDHIQDLLRQRADEATRAEWERCAQQFKNMSNARLTMSGIAPTRRRGTRI